MKLESLISIRITKKKHQLQFLFESMVKGKVFFFMLQQLPLRVGLLSVLVVMVTM